MISTRFAPSPTGRLHLGHAYSALLAHRFARDHGGTIGLRIEDIDAGRSRPEHVDAIIEDLDWLGVHWDGEITYQSERLALYAEALETLKRQGLAYPCFCTRAEIAAEIAASALAPHGPDGAIYPGTCRGRAYDKAELAERPHAWRLDMDAALMFSRESGSPGAAPELAPRFHGGTLKWHDETAGDVEAHPERFGDVILARKDAPTSYHLAVTVDDAAQGITDIVRGHDLFHATDVHRLLQALLGLPTPRYHHHPLLAGADGKRLAKRHDAPTLADLRAAGADPVALAADLMAGRLPAGYSATAA